MSENGTLLSVRDLAVSFFTDEGQVRAVGGVSFDVPAGQTVALAGESGCGKSVTALSILRLIPDPPGKIVGGSIRFRGQDVLTVSERQMRSIRVSRALRPSYGARWTSRCEMSGSRQATVRTAPTGR